MPVPPQQPVLIVEDDDDSRGLLATILALNSYAVVCASNGPDGLALARQYQPCLILLDVMMPGMDGPEFRGAQLNDAAIKNIPVMLVTAAPSGDRLAQKLRALCCIQKPVDFQQLLQQVARHCERSPGSRVPSEASGSSLA